jgi:hypothetical protein
MQIFTTPDESQFMKVFERLSAKPDTAGEDDRDSSGSSRESARAKVLLLVLSHGAEPPEEASKAARKVYRSRVEKVLELLKPTFALDSLY